MQVAGQRYLSCPWSCLQKSSEKHQWRLPLLLGAPNLSLSSLGIWLTYAAAMCMPKHVPVHLDADFGLRTSSLAWPGTRPIPCSPRWQSGILHWCWTPSSALPCSPHSDAVRQDPWQQGPCPGNLDKTPGLLLLLEQPTLTALLTPRSGAASGCNPERTFSNYYCSLASTSSFQ